MHPATQRLYQAVQMLTRSAVLPKPGQVAREANISPQVLKNWEDRGPSAEGLLDFQQAHGVNATWVRTGQGPLMVGGTSRLRAGEPPAPYDAGALTPEVLQALSRLDPEARRRIENGLRGQLELPPLARAANRSAA